MKTALVFGAGGFIGSHLVRRLKSEGYWVRGVDLKHPPFRETVADSFELLDLSIASRMAIAFMNGAPSIDEVYQLAADMGGAGYIFTGENDANVMSNSALINLNAVRCAKRFGVKKIFFSSSACVYPERNQTDPLRPDCSEESCYPAAPDSEYGWEKIFSERLYAASARNWGLSVRIARFHNIFGPEGTWTGGKEKAPAAICRKVAEARDGGEVEIWGTGDQTRSFLYIEECLEGVRRLMESDYSEPVNIGSEEMISIRELVSMVARIAGKNVTIRSVDGPTGVNGRRSDNRLIQSVLGWSPKMRLETGMALTYKWIQDRVSGRRR